MKKAIILIATSVLIARPDAHAGMVTVSGLGTWGADAPDSLYSAAGASWSFSFDIPDPLDAASTSTATNFQFFLDGSAVSATLSSVEFFDASQGGGFDLNFDDGNTLNLYLDEVLSSPGLSLDLGVYSSNIDINAFNVPPDGSGAGVVTLALAVPEPSSLASGGLALSALAGYFIRSRRRKAG